MPGRLGIDVGETGADLLVLDDRTGRTHALKIRDGDDDIPGALGRGLRDLIGRAGMQPGEIGTVVAGIADLDGLPAPRVGLLVTRGFEQVLHLGTGRRAGPLPVGLDMTAGIVERVSARGDAITPLDETSARHAVNRLVQAGAEVLAVCLVNAPANPVHEMQVRDIAAEMARDVPVVLSHLVAPEAGEHGRALATVLTARSRPGLKHRLEAIAAGLRSAEIGAVADVAQVAGGRTHAGHALETPLAALAAGRAGAAAAAARIAAAAGFPDALVLDLGGGAADVALVRGGLARVANRIDAGGEPVPVAGLDVRRAGGGTRSVAQSPFAGAIHVGVAGDGPTVADASIVLGRLPAERLGLDTDPAEKRMAAFADASGLDRHRAAEAILAVFEEDLAGALRLAAVEKGEDPTRMALVACGGAGPMHGCALGAVTGADPVIVPPAAGALAALGFASAAPSAQFAHHVGQPLDSLTANDAEDVLNLLRARAQAWLDGEGAPGRIEFRADLRVHRGHFQLSTGIDPDALGEPGGPAVLSDRLAEAHRRRFGLPPGGPAELVALRAIARVDGDPVAPPRATRGGTDPRAAVADQAQVWFDGAFVTAPLYDRDRLDAGNRIPGPALIVETGTTTVIGPGHVAEIDENLNILIRPDSGTGQRQ